ncbi:Complex I-B14.5a [Aphelenchoides bicaudatus]|nr:Complex I-B14.5a [Aphelenchoides bicaudatus]
MPSSQHVGKIASAAVKNREQTPLISWIRDKLLAVNRSPKTKPAGLPGPDGGSQYSNPSRYPNTQASRAIEMPKLPGGINHRLADVYYYDRDGRRSVVPPPEFCKVDENGQTFYDLEGKAMNAEDVTKAVVKGPAENFGLSGPPTPGVGYEWTRNISLERDGQKNDPNLKKLEKYDRYMKA